MSRRIRVRGVRREEIDSDKLAIAFLMLAKILQDQEPLETPSSEHQVTTDADRRAS